MRPSKLIRNRPLCVLAIFLAMGAFLLPFLNHAPNRLISGRPIWLMSLSAPSIGLMLMPGLMLAVGPFVPQSRRLCDGVALAAFLFVAVLLFVAGAEANRISAAATATARMSFGSGFWVMSIAAALILAEILARAGHSAATRLFIGAAMVLPAAVMIGFGHLDQLSVMKEYANKSDVFRQAVAQHVVIVGGALVPTLLLGVPLGVLAFRRKAFGRGVLAGLNMIQTIPSIALFGLLMAPLSALALAMPALGKAGISGIGLAPAIIALTLYCLLPIVRNTREGLVEVPDNIVEAARGMGLTDWQILWQVQVPLALPVFLSGLRVTLIQAIGLAAVAALIGAGGLGSIMFQGLFANALDLVLLGAVPIVMMVVVVDALFKLVVDRLKGAVR
jgi:osmoprotectant transport system permease protein